MCETVAFVSFVAIEEADVFEFGGIVKFRESVAECSYLSDGDVSVVEKDDVPLVVAIFLRPIDVSAGDDVFVHELPCVFWERAINEGFFEMS